MSRNWTRWAVISTLSLVGCTAGGPKLLSRAPVATTTLKPPAFASETQASTTDGDVLSRSAGKSRSGTSANQPDSGEQSRKNRPAEIADRSLPRPASDRPGNDNIAGKDSEDGGFSRVQPIETTESDADIQLTKAQADAGEPLNRSPAAAKPQGAAALPPAPLTDNVRDLLTIEQEIGEANARAGLGSQVTLGEVIDSIYQSYPLLEAAIYGRNIAAGQQLAAEGAYDLKLKASSDSMPLGYYRNYRQGVGVEQNLYYGGQVFGGYRVGRGEFQPWYQERVTNEGGEFTAGFMMPLAQNRAIDPRRAELWKKTYGRDAVEPGIQTQLINFVYAGSMSYWTWVGSGQNSQYAEQLFRLAEARNQQLQELVGAGALPESVLIDNQRLIVSRQVKLIDARRKLQQAGVKLSLFLRTPNGMPYIPDNDQLPMFPEPVPVNLTQLPADISEARSRRPELRELDFDRRIAEVDLAQAHNLTQPELDATFWGAQDVGGFSSSKGDKQPLELQGSLNFSMPLQRRAAQGKIREAEGKITQINIKRQYTADRIETEVRNATIALDAAFRALGEARRSVALNVQMQELETVQVEEGSSDLLRLNLREEQTFDARVTEVEALLRYFEAQAELRAAMGLDADGLATLNTPAQF